MEEKLIIPLFVLSHGIFPYCQEPLRVFEPRYKQMLDDCVIEKLSFGYVANDFSSDLIDGWTPPSEYGVLSNAEEISEQGTNLLFIANGKKRFRIKKIIPAALPSETFDDIFPSVNELEELYIEQFPEGKLYLRAEIEILPDFSEEIEQERWNEFLFSWSKHILEMNLVFGRDPININEITQIINKEFYPPSELKLWDACNIILDTSEKRQKALSAINPGDIMNLLEISLKEKDAQIKYIKSLMNNEEEE